MATRVRRHYRAARKQIEQTMPKIKGTFITKKQKNHMIICGVTLLVLVFIKGLLIGYFVGREKL